MGNLKEYCGKERALKNMVSRKKYQERGRALKYEILRNVAGRKEPLKCGKS
jgi:hypothetical protein